MREKSNHKIQLDKFVPGGQVLGTLPDGKKVFVWGGLPNEEVEIEITKSKKSYCEGIVSKVIKPSPYRIEPKDDCYLSTSPWQVLEWEYELRQKEELVIEAFHQQGIRVKGQEVRVKSDNKQYFYRNKMEYSLYWNNETNKVELAFFKRGTHQKVPIKQSSIEMPEILKQAKYIINDINKHKLEARQFSSLMIRANQKGEVRSMLFERGKPHVKEKFLTDTIMNHKYSYSPNGFFQINLPVYEMALEQMKKYVSGNNILELYAGVGTIGLSIAPVIARSEATKQSSLMMIESDKDAFKELENNVSGLLRQKPRNDYIKAINAKSEDVLEYLTNDIDTLILDPPRAGLDPKVISKVLLELPETIIYLSCNPTTQARDIALLTEKYEIKLLQPYNFFPRTPHIENLVVLSKQN